MADEKKLILPYVEEPDKEELDKKAEEAEKEVKKTLVDKVKIADDINGKEHIKAMPEEPKMPKNEKLILKEPETNLSEDLGNDLNNFGRDVYDAIKGVLNKYPGADIDDVKFALRYFGGRVNFGNNTWDESLEEALPRDLAKAYDSPHKITGNSNAHSTERQFGYGSKKGVSSIDFQNSEYTEITPEEAIAMKKAGDAEKLRVIFDGQLVTFDEKGKQTLGKFSARAGYGSNWDKYTGQSTTGLSATNYMTFNQVVKNADKIYVADEKPIDRELQGERSENPESKHYNKQLSDRDLVSFYSGSKSRSTYLGSRSRWRLEDAIKFVKGFQKELDSLNKKLADAKASGDDERVASLEDKIDALKRQYAKASKMIGSENASSSIAKARLRYLPVEQELQEPFKELERLKSSLSDSEEKLSRAQKSYDEFKASGSPKVREYKSDLEDAKQQLRNLKRRISELEIKIQASTENEGPELQQALNDLMAASEEVNGVNARINQLLRRG